MTQFQIIAENVSKAYELGKWVFVNQELQISNSMILGITGGNGSGKSTLLKILAGVINPTKGAVRLFVNGAEVEQELFYERYGFTAPYLNIYDEFSPMEHFRLISKMRGISFINEIGEEKLRRVNLFTRRNEPIRTFSSGMKQRFKLAQAIIHKPSILFLDEPSTNLDSAGIAMLESIVQEQKDSGGAVVLATNDSLETSWCEKTIKLSGNRL